MNHPFNVLIPARSGSKGIKNKNLQMVGDRTLLEHTIAVAKRLGAKEVTVSSDDLTTLDIALAAGVLVHHRTKGWAKDDVSLDDFVAHYRDRMHDVRYGLLVLQPTVSLTVADDVPYLRSHLKSVELYGYSVAFVQPVDHLVWRASNLTWLAPPSRTQRQDSKKTFWQEIGVRFYPKGIRSSSPLRPWATTGGYVDVDTPEDLAALKAVHTRQQTVLFKVSANPETGLGHFYRSLAIATALPEYDCQFVIDGETTDEIRELVGRELAPLHLRTWGVGHQDWYVNVLDSAYANVDSIAKADIVIEPDIPWHATWPPTFTVDPFRYMELSDHDRFGFDWCMFRPEFHAERRRLAATHFTTATYQPVPGVRPKILVTFGGTDPSGYTQQIVDKLHGKNCDYTVIHPPGKVGYRHVDVAAEIAKADFVITGGGRTVYEAAYLGTPVFSIAQNEREGRHFHRHTIETCVPSSVETLLADIFENPQVFRQEALRRQAHKIDGRGVDRFRHLVEEVMWSKSSLK